MEPVEQKVQSRARSDLTKVKRQAGFAGNREETRQEHGRAGDLIGLRRAVQSGAEPCIMARNGAGDSRANGITRGRSGWIDAG